MAKRIITLEVMKQIYTAVDDIRHNMVVIANLNNHGNTVVVGDKIMSLGRKLHGEMIKIEDKFYKDNDVSVRFEYDKWLSTEFKTKAIPTP